MATTAAPYGLVPINVIGGLPFAGSTRFLKVTNSYGTSIFNGDVVKLAATGTVEKDTGTTTATPVGVFLGCQYTDPGTSQIWQRNWWTASTVATDIMAYVLDNPNQLFQIQASGSIAQTGLGNNAALVQTAGSTANGKSKVALNHSSIATTDTLPLRIIDFVYGPDSAPGDAYTDVIVKFNNHLYTTLTGV